MDERMIAKCEILQDAYRDFYEDPEWEEFFPMNDLGIFCAVTYCAGSSEPTSTGVQDIENAYGSLCEKLGVDVNFPFTTIDQMLQ